MTTDPSRLHALNYSFKSARAAHVAAKLDLFTKLHDAGTGLTRNQLVEQLGLSKSADRGSLDWLDVLVALDLLQRHGDGENALYANSPEAEAFLVKGAPGFIGAAFVLSHDRTWHVFSDLLPALQQGEIADMRVPRISDTNYNAADGSATEDFALGMASINSAAFHALAAKLDFSKYHTTADIGGSIGELSCVLAAAHPHLRCTTCDLPTMAPHAARNVARHGLQQRVAVAEIDFLQDAFPAADVITMSMVLHNWSLERKLLLVQKAAAALPPGGMFLEINSIVDNDRRSPLGGLELSLTQLAEFGHENAFVYTFQDFDEWARKAGFSRTTSMHLAGVKSVAIAYK